MKIKKLLKLFPELIVKGPKEGEITGITSNSKSSAPGSLFVAKKGLRSHGADYIQDAVAAGAVCLCLDTYDPLFPDTTQLLTPFPEKYESLLTAAFYQHPSQKLFTVGITGTSGKTTISYLVKHLLCRLSFPAGLIGSIEYDTGACKHLASHTTPDNPSLQRYLYEMVGSGKKAAIMEVTSHALSQGRVDNIHFDVAVFSNLSQDHLDYHHTMEAYALEKRKLFSFLNAPYPPKKERWKKTAIVNCDSPWAKQMVEDLYLPVFLYGKRDGVDLQLKSHRNCANGMCIRLCYLNSEREVELPLVGEHNAYNALAAIGVCLSQGYCLEQVIKAFQGFQAIPGRLEKIDLGQHFSVYVDFAHKPDALKCVLQAVREKTEGKLYLVVGCGGDRDKEKRPLMGAIADKNADFTFLADDNPRTEDPQVILEEIAKGFKGCCYEKVGNRALAIKRAVEAAKSGDAVLIAGKGHETVQIFAHHSVEFDDRQEAKRIIQDSLSSNLAGVK